MIKQARLTNFYQLAQYAPFVDRNPSGRGRIYLAIINCLYRMGGRDVLIATQKYGTSW